MFNINNNGDRNFVTFQSNFAKIFFKKSVSEKQGKRFLFLITGTFLSKIYLFTSLILNKFCF